MARDAASSAAALVVGDVAGVMMRWAAVEGSFCIISKYSGSGDAGVNPREMTWACAAKASRFFFGDARCGFGGGLPSIASYSV